MSQIISIIENLDGLIELKPATQEDVFDIEIELALPLSEEYKTYLMKFGAIMANGIELTGFAKSKNRNIVDVTRREWELNDKVPHTMYVIENVGIDGIIIWQDKSGKIYQSSPSIAPFIIANSLSDYLNNK